MASQHPLQVPEITIPAHSPKPFSQTGGRPSPETSYFSLHPHPQSRSSPGDVSASPAPIQPTDPDNSSYLLKTPPVPDSRQDSSSFTSPRRSQSRQTRTTSPSEQLSNPANFSPGISSGGSFYSSEFGHSQCSHSSGELLTPPQAQSPNENPPYKPRRPSSPSLTMVRKLRRANTMPDDKEHKRNRRRRRHHKCGQKKVKLYEHQNRSYWWLPSGCQVAPTAPRGQKQLCEGHAGHYTPMKTRYGNIDTYGKLPPDVRAKPAPAVVTRRWSSVEIGAHQIILESTLPVKPPASVHMTSKNSSSNNNFAPRMLSKPYRSSTFTRGAIDHDRDYDFVRVVRQRLTLRKVPDEKLDTPDTITLRRASGESPEASYSNKSGEVTPSAGKGNLEQKRISAAYLITAEDIESITELIEANLRKNYDAFGRYDQHASSTPGSQTIPNSSATGTTLVPSKSYLNQPLGAVTEAQPDIARPRSPLGFLQVVPECKTKKGGISRTDSQKSVHEVIWESGGAPRSLSSLTDEDDSKPLDPCSSEPSTSDKMTLHTLQASRGDKGDAFDPQNANASINEWSWRCPQYDISVVLTSSDSDSNDILLEGGSDRPQIKFKPEISPPKESPKTRARPPLRSAFSETRLQDVVSFPPLAPRKKTNDWYSPLPPIDMSPSLATSRSLYDIGIDVSFGPDSSRTVTPKSSQTSWVRSTEVSPSRSIEFDPGYEIRCKILEPLLEEQNRRKSVIKAHPSASARTGDPLTAGSSLGISSHERRKSSTPSIQLQHSPRIIESAAVRALMNTTSGARQGTHRVQQSRPIDDASTKSISSVDSSERSSSPVLPSRRVATPEPIPEKASGASHPDETEISSPPRLPRVRTIDNAHKGEHEGPPTKWRAPSPCPTPRSPSPSEYTSEYEDARESPSGSPDPAITTHVRRAWVDRLSLIKARSPPLLAVDRVGIYGRMTGSQGARPGESCRGTSKSKPHVCDVCPRVSEPHICDDCAKDPRTLSVDWIG
ncbi:hypothetical protein N431DRAFT_436577 [Stipitochalara longipes BDJ]|nr:hypothetical protein N431DRAFT_436577 [Stipitochalara longipes BDJ]